MQIERAQHLTNTLTRLHALGMRFQVLAAKWGHPELVADLGKLARSVDTAEGLADEIEEAFVDHAPEAVLLDPPEGVPAGTIHMVWDGEDEVYSLEGPAYRKPGGYLVAIEHEHDRPDPERPPIVHLHGADGTDYIIRGCTVTSVSVPGSESTWYVVEEIL